MRFSSTTTSLPTAQLTNGKMTRHISLILACVLSGAVCLEAFARTSLGNEMMILRNVAVALESYWHDNAGQWPSNLEPLGSYLDAERLLHAAPGSSPEFTTQYAFMTSSPKLRFKSLGEVQLVLLEVHPRDGVRLAIWIGPDGMMPGTLDEEELVNVAAGAIDLNHLRPMGGVVPHTKRSQIDTQKTDYRTQVEELFLQGKIPLDPPRVAAEAAPQPRAQNTSTPNPSTPLPQTPSPVAQKQERAFPWLAVIAALGAVGAVTLLVWKRSN